MNIITFPGLNLKFNISKIAFIIFGVPVYKYAVCIVLGILVALFLCRISKQKFEIKYEDILVCTVIGLMFGIIGARLYYVIFNLEYYSKNIIEIFNIRNGGLAIYGGLFLGALAICVYCKYKKIKVLDLFDYTVPYIAIAQSIGRFGNFFNLEAYGEETTSLLRMGIITNSGYIEVHPTFLYESFTTFVIFLILKILQKYRKFDRRNFNFVLYVIFNC